METTKKTEGKTSTLAGGVTETAKPKRTKMENGLEQARSLKNFKEATKWCIDNGATKEELIKVLLEDN